MTEYVSDVAFTAAVKEQQALRGSREGYAARVKKRDWHNTVTPELAAFIAERESFYLATASADGQPYIQHRGGQPGFLKVLDEHTLAFADFGGNKQYISVGNLTENSQAHMFLMDYAGRRRIKIWGRARVAEDDPELLDRLSEPGYDGVPERVFVFEVAAWDVNCPQHITPRFTELQIAPTIDKLNARIAELEAELDKYRQTD